MIFDDLFLSSSSCTDLLFPVLAIAYELFQWIYMFCYLSVCCFLSNAYSPLCIYFAQLFCLAFLHSVKFRRWSRYNVFSFPFKDLFIVCSLILHDPVGSTYFGHKSSLCMYMCMRLCTTDLAYHYLGQTYWGVNVKTVTEKKTFKVTVQSSYR